MSERRRHRLCVAYSAAAVLFLLAAGHFTFTFGADLWRLWLARDWKEVPATVEEASRKPAGEASFSDRDGPLQVKFRYTVGDTAYTSSSVYLDPQLARPETDELILRELRAAQSEGRTVTCFVNPDAPGNAVLNLDFPYQFLPVFITLMAFFFGGSAWLATRAWYIFQADAQRSLLSRKHPAAPWRWRKDWDRGLLFATRRLRVIEHILLIPLLPPFLLLGVTVFVSAFLSGQKLLVLPAVVFLLAAGSIFVRAARTAYLWRRFGNMRLRLITLPGTIGGRFEACVEVPGRNARDAQCFIALRCAHAEKAKTDPDNALLWESTLFHEESPTDARWTGLKVPVGFDVPAELPPTSDEIAWRLDVALDAGKSHYFASFDVPLYPGDIVHGDKAT